MKPSRTFMGKVRKHVIGLETLLRLSQHGDGCYAFIPKDIVDCFHLLPGDRVQVKLVASYRLLSGVEQEEADAICEEKVEPTLVVPKQRRRRKPKLDSDSEFQEPSEKEDEPIQKVSENEPMQDSEEEDMNKGEL